jgi:hypothetical protein
MAGAALTLPSRVEPALRRARSRGAVFLETLVVLPILLAFVLGTIQLALLLGARLLVTRAAERAARAAAVVATDAPRFADGAERGDFSARSPRTRIVRDAVRLMLAPLEGESPWEKTSLESAFEVSSTLTLAAAASLLPERTFVEITTATGRERAEPNDVLRVKVTHLFSCRVPLGARILCEGGLALLLTESVSTLLSERADSPTYAKAGLALGRYAVLEAEATLPNHGARYFPEGR